jgi:hypothetical protein
MGLMRYVAATPLGRRVRITVAGEVVAAAPARDPWNAWVFTISASGYLSGESQQHFSSYDGSLSANRTTEGWKIRLSGRGNYGESEFEVDSTLTVTSLRRSYNATALVVRSLGPRLSAGLQFDFQSSTFSNLETSYRLAPALEFDVFPYAQSTRRSFTLTYSLGAASFDYRERTIYDEVKETRPTHTLAVSYSTRQPWGSSSVGLSGRQFLHDASKYSWAASTNASIRLFRGMSLNVGGYYSRVRDQLALPAGTATTEEILLRQRLLRTNFFYGVSFGLSYRFGSIFNTVVNPRLNNLAGGGEIFFF